MNKVQFKFRKYLCSCHAVILKWLYVNTLQQPIDRDYILVLCQYHPEQTTSSSALDTPFECRRITEIANQFPDMDIIVREHPSNLIRNDLIQYRPLSSVRDMLKHENVKYIIPGNRADYRELVKNSVAIVSTSGTAAFESILLGVPAVHFSYSFANGFPGVRNLQSVSQLTKDELLQMRNELEACDEEAMAEGITEAFSKRPMKEGFICGFHVGEYNESEYVNNAAEILYSCLDYLFRFLEPIKNESV